MLKLSTFAYKILISSCFTKYRDISVKPSVFDSLPIPFKLVYGKVGLIYAEVPVMSLFSSPLKIKIQDAFVLIK